VNSPSDHGFSLSSLFVLVTACASLVAGFTPLVRHYGEAGITTSILLSAMTAGFFAGMMLGLVLGLLQFRLGIAVPLGALAGGIIGLAAGLIALLPQAHLGTSAIAMLVGSMLVVGVALATRRINSQ
jgi:hypothetical protein